MNSDLHVTNCSWEVHELYRLTKNNQIKKPKFQRKKKWMELPYDDDGVKHNKPNYQEYIDFLFRTKNTINPISFGERIQNGILIYDNIDGNNRINAIITFINSPFVIYPKYLDNLNTFIKNLDITNIELQNKRIQFFSKLTYDDIYQYRRISDLYKNNKEAKLLINDYKQNDIQEIEKKIDEIRSKLCFGNNGSFLKEVNININLFKNASFQILCQIFEDINRHNNSLTKSELLASMLFHHSNYNIINIDHNLQIRKEIKKYYEERDSNEVLLGYKPIEDSEDINNFELNAFDIIVGLQNYCYNKYENIIPQYEPSDISLYFKLYEHLYKTNKDLDLDPYDNKIFNEKNINDFIQTVLHACDFLDECINKKMFSKNIDETLFNKTGQRKSLILKKNNLLVIMISIIYGFKNDIDLTIISQSVIKCIIYHMLMKEIDKKKDDNLQYLQLDSIQYRAGGGVIDSKVNEIKADPLLISNKITKDIMKNVIKSIMKDVNSPVAYNVKPRRRKLQFIDKCLMSYYYKECVSNNYLNNEFSIEHIIPYSTTWLEGSIDINRIGNLVPIIKAMNGQRQNFHIEYYKNKNSTYTSFIKSIPSIQEYDTIIKHNTFNNQIININNYNKMCEKNEKMYLDNFLNILFNE
jgi:hypothetical protein